MLGFTHISVVAMPDYSRMLSGVHTSQWILDLDQQWHKGDIPYHQDLSLPFIIRIVQSNTIYAIDIWRIGPQFKNSWFLIISWYIFQSCERAVCHVWQTSWTSRGYWQCWYSITKTFVENIRTKKPFISLMITGSIRLIVVRSSMSHNHSQEAARNKKVITQTFWIKLSKSTKYHNLTSLWPFKPWKMTLYASCRNREKP